MMTSASAKMFSIRPMGLSDVDKIADWFSDFDDMAMFDRSLPVPVSPECVREMWKKSLEVADPPRSIWFIAEDESYAPAAVCGLQSINYIHGDAIIPMFVGAQMRGKGLALAMSAWIIDLAFYKLRLHRLTTFFREDNEPSRAIVSKAGFQDEGRIRQAWYSEGAHKDIIQVGLLKSHWEFHRVELRKQLENATAISIMKRPAAN